MKRLSPLLAIFLTVFVDLIGFGIVIPLLPFYAEHFRASPEAVTFLMATYSLTQFVFAPFWGRLSDRYGRKPILLTSLAGIAGSYIWIGFADSLIALFAARALAGAMAGNIAAAQAYVADVTPPEKRAHGMGLIGAAFGLGFILGPAIGGALGGMSPENPHFLAPALTASGLSLLALLFASLFLKESLGSERRAAIAATPRTSRLTQLSQALRNAELQLTMLLFFLVVFVFSGMESTFALWSERTFGWGGTQNGYLFAYVGIIAALVQGGIVRKLAPRFGEARVIIQGAAALACGLLMISLTRSLPLVIAAMTLLALGFGLSSPSLNSLVSQIASRSSRGGIMGISQSAGSLARILGPIFAGWAFAGLGRNAPYAFGAALMVVVFLLGIRLPRRVVPSGSP